MKIIAKKARYLTDRKIIPKLLIIHHTATFGNCSNYLANPSDGRKVSCHFMIHSDGILYVYTNLICVTEGWAKNAWHAGKSRWNFENNTNDADGKTGVGSYSIGIELTGNGNLKPYTKIQMESLYEISKRIVKAFPTISDAAHVQGHSDISLAGKVDPGKYFDWDEFEIKVFGKDAQIHHK